MFNGFHNQSPLVTMGTISDSWWKAVNIIFTLYRLAIRYGMNRLTAKDYNKSFIHIEDRAGAAGREGVVN